MKETDTKDKPFSLLIKPASADCNLRCSYCFYLEKSSLYPDSSRHRMSEEVLERTIASYMETDQPNYTFGWQGGEPTLMGLDFFKQVIELQKKHGKEGSRVSNGLQTNGTLLDDEWAEFLSRYNFLIGVSLDGPREIHDEHRTTIDGRGSYEDVMSGIETLERHDVQFNILVLVNSANVNRAAEVYQFLCDQGFYHHQYIPCVEFDEEGQPLPYTITGEEWGDFLCEIFDQWNGSGRNRPSIRLFDSLLSFMVNGDYTVCQMSGSCSEYCVVEHNGDVYPCDFFVEPELKMGNISDSSWEELRSSQIYRDFARRKSDWSDECQNCAYLDFCSGGCQKQRVYNDNPPDHQSWLCPGWKKFYDHALPSLKRTAESIVRRREGSGRGRGKLFMDRKFKRNEPCFCGSGRKYKNCHGAR